MGKAGKKKRNKPRHAPAHFSVPDNPDRAPETAGNESAAQENESVVIAKDESLRLFVSQVVARAQLTSNSCRG
eukprot:m.80713 g.80713  ORF g.80713 m.80713 type:complete len:73 (-) comp12776_c0_seq1:19-237(-)